MVEIFWFQSDGALAPPQRTSHNHSFIKEENNSNTHSFRAPIAHAHSRLKRSSPGPVHEGRGRERRVDVDGRGRPPNVVLERGEVGRVPAVLVAARGALVLHRCKTRKR